MRAILRPDLLPARAIAAAAALSCSAMTAPTWAANASCQRVDIAPAVKVALGKSTIVRPSAPIQRIVLGSAAPAGPAANAGPPGALANRLGAADVDVTLLGPSEVYLLGKSLGSTNVVLMDRNGVCTAFDVLVSMDAVGLQSLITELLPQEKSVKVTTANDAIVLSGEVSDNEALNRIMDLANAFAGSNDAAPAGTRAPKVINMLSVGAPQQVLLEVKVAEISKTLLDEFGIDFSRTFANAKGTSIQALSGLLGGSPLSFDKFKGTGSGSSLSSVGAVVGGSLSGGATAGNVTSTPVFDSSGNFLYNNYTTTYGTVPAKGVNSTKLNMQKTDGLVKVLAEPTIMAISGQTGSFLAGGKILIPVSQNSSNNSTSITLEEKEFGVSVSFTPTVLGSGRINLHVRPEVSELNANGVTVAGLTGSSVLPSFTSRKAETTVQLADGQSFAIGGLVKNNATTSITAFPFLGEIPILGALFRSSQFQTDRTELVFVITPRLVKPLPADYALPTDNYVAPTRADVILRGRTEGRPTERAEEEAHATPPAAVAPAPVAPTDKGGFDTTVPKDKP
jgi:pilus assembly protein CpaC